MVKCKSCMWLDEINSELFSCRLTLSSLSEKEQEIGCESHYVEEKEYERPILPNRSN